MKDTNLCQQTVMSNLLRLLKKVDASLNEYVTLYTKTDLKSVIKQHLGNLADFPHIRFGNHHFLRYIGPSVALPGFNITILERLVILNVPA